MKKKTKKNLLWICRFFIKNLTDYVVPEWGEDCVWKKSKRKLDSQVTVIRVKNLLPIRKSVY